MASGWLDKIKDYAKGNPKQAEEAIEKVEDVIDQRTGGKYSDQIDRGGDALKDKLGLPDDPAAKPQPPGDTVPAPAPSPVPGEPAPMPSPTPDPMPAPTPDPMPAPTPEPTPAPTPEPMPTPTPDPGPETGGDDASGDKQLPPFGNG